MRRIWKLFSVVEDIFILSSVFKSNFLLKFFLNAGSAEDLEPCAHFDESNDINIAFL